jgi:hypothetical protein
MNFRIVVLSGKGYQHSIEPGNESCRIFELTTFRQQGLIK